MTPQVESEISAMIEHLSKTKDEGRIFAEVLAATMGAYHEGALEEFSEMVIEFVKYHRLVMAEKLLQFSEKSNETI